MNATLRNFAVITFLTMSLQACGGASPAMSPLPATQAASGPSPKAPEDIYKLCASGVPCSAIVIRIPLKATFVGTGAITFIQDVAGAVPLTVPQYQLTVVAMANAPQMRCAQCGITLATAPEPLGPSMAPLLDDPTPGVTMRPGVPIMLQPGTYYFYQANHQ